MDQKPNYYPQNSLLQASCLENEKRKKTGTLFANKVNGARDAMNCGSSSQLRENYGNFLSNERNIAISCRNPLNPDPRNHYLLADVNTDAWLSMLLFLFFLLLFNANMHFSPRCFKMTSHYILCVC